jgi:hypothetical protein
LPRARSAEDPGLNSGGLLRRSAIKKIGLMIAGITIASVGGATILGSIERKLQEKPASLANGNNSAISESSSTQFSTSSTSSLITIKAVYFGMSTQIQGTKQDYITLKSPAFLKDAISEVTERHPALIPMIGAMQILIDGNPAEPNQQLANKDEIGFIPLQAGG